jgi:long-chain fatty acid transport protein
MKKHIFFWLILANVCVASLKYKPFFTYYNFAFGSKAAALGNAFTAYADDLSAIYFNPAGIADCRHPRIYINFYSDKITQGTSPEDPTIIDFSSNFTCSTGNLNFAAISFPFAVWQAHANIAIGYYRLLPYHLTGKVEHFQDNDQSPVQILNFSGNKGIDALAVSYALDFNSNFALGFTIQQFINSGTITYWPNLQELSESESYTESIKGRNIIVGLLFRPYHFLNLGFSYQSRLKNIFSQKYQLGVILDPAEETKAREYEVLIPPRLALGVSIKPFPFLRMCYEYSRMYWSNAWIYNYQETAADYPFPTKNDFTFSNHDTINYRWGLEAGFPHEDPVVFTRCGYFRETQLFLDSLDQPIDIQGISGGIGLKIKSNFMLEIAFSKQSAEWPEYSHLSPALLQLSHFSKTRFTMGFTYALLSNQENYSAEWQLKNP